jgi:hypothetical protein
MPPMMTIIRWRDIPAQVTAKDGSTIAKRVLHRRFQVAIDRAAMRAGKKSASDYIGEWASDRTPCGADVQAEVDSTVARLEHEHTREVLAQLVASGGWRDPAAHPEATVTDEDPGDDLDDEQDPA